AHWAVVRRIDSGSTAARAAWPRMRPEPSALAGLTGSRRSGAGPRAALAQQYLRAIFQLVGTIDDHRVAGLEARANGDVVGIAGTQGHYSHAHGLICVDHVDKGARCTALHARLRDERCAMQRVEQQIRVDELLRKKAP